MVYCIPGDDLPISSKNAYREFVRGQSFFNSRKGVSYTFLELNTTFLELRTTFLELYTAFLELYATFLELNKLCPLHKNSLYAFFEPLDHQ
jgi:hypothetical protein